MLGDFPKMVEWYSPKLLLKAAIEVVISTIFGRHADQRTVHALTGQARVFDYSSGHRTDISITPRLLHNITNLGIGGGAVESEGPEIWFDYIADTGDGWDSTYSVAYLATRQQLEIALPGQPAKETLPQGRFILFGGDEVYPTASREEYDRRFITPYQTALNDGQHRKDIDVYAIPGNHDWYDSLRSFSRIFFTEGPFVDVPGLESETPQTRSYFAIKLPSNWWLLATDVQLGSDIDANQLEYFRAVARKFETNDKIILCTAEPHWISAKKAQKREAKTAFTALDRLEQEILGSRVRVFVAGDVHHYMRFESEGDPSTKVHKITAGGGGAFLHPTHRTWGRKIIEPAIDGKRPPRMFERPDDAVFPPTATSMLLSLRNWLFIVINPRFGILTALLYVVFALMMMPAFIRHEESIDRERQAQLQKHKDQLQQQFVAEVRQFMRLTSAEPVSGSLDALPSEPEEVFMSDGISGDRTLSLDFAQSPSGRKLMMDEVSANRYKSGRVSSESGEIMRQSTQQYADIQELSARLDRVDESIAEVTKGDYVHKVSRTFFRPTDQVHGDVQPSAALETSKGPEAVAVGPLATPIEKEAELEPAEPVSLFPWVLDYLVVLGVQEAALPDPFLSMLAILVFITAIAGFVAFTDVPNLLFRLALGTSHGCVHWFAAFLITLAAFPALDSAWQWVCGIVAVCGLIITVAYARSADQPGSGILRRAAPLATVFTLLFMLLLYLAGKSDLRNSAVIIIVFVGGWVVGSFLMGAYLFFAHMICGQHWNEAFSSIQCRDWKCFLRFHISSDGRLTIYPIGIPKTCRSWRISGRHVDPNHGSELQPLVIEGPLVLH